VLLWLPWVHLENKLLTIEPFCKDYILTYVQIVLSFTDTNFKVVYSADSLHIILRLIRAMDFYNHPWPSFTKHQFLWRSRHYEDLNLNFCYSEILESKNEVKGWGCISVVEHMHAQGPGFNAQDQKNSNEG
jgi:hypothetical protein